jgi:hypothetical protein
MKLCSAQIQLDHIGSSIKKPASRRKPVHGLKLALSHASEAVRAVNGAIGLRLEGNLCLSTAGCANSSEILSGAALCVLASVTASLATLGLVLEAALSIELLLTGSKGKLSAALFTNQNLVFVHNAFPLFKQIDLPFATQEFT